MKTKSGRNRPLKVFVKSGVLTIEIGIDTLSCAALHSEYLYKQMGRKQNRPDTRFHICNNNGFATDVARELMSEEEDGSSLLTDLFDKATQEAIEQGSEWFHDAKYDDGRIANEVCTGAGHEYTDVTKQESP